MSTIFIGPDIEYLQELDIFKNKVKTKLGTYNTMEHMDDITYFSAEDENEYDLKCDFVEHNRKSSFFDIISEEKFLTIGDEILFIETSNPNMDSTISRQTTINNNVISRTSVDHMYKVVDGEVVENRSGSMVQFCTVYDKNSNLSEPIAIIKDTYKSDNKDEFIFKKIDSTIVTLSKQEGNNTFFEGTESIILNNSDSIGDYLQGKCIYAYTAWNELLRISIRANNISNDMKYWILPKATIKDNKCIVKYMKRTDPVQILSTEEYEIVDDSLVLKSIDASEVRTSFTDNGDGTYTYTSKITAGYNDYELEGVINIPTSGELFGVSYVKEKSTCCMTYKPYFNNIFASDPAGQFYYIQGRVNYINKDGEKYTEYEYDEYNMVKSQWFYANPTTSADMAEYKVSKFEDKTVIESLSRLDPANHKAKGLYYRAIMVDENNNIVKDYRTTMIK